MEPLFSSVFDTESESENSESHSTLIFMSILSTSSSRPIIEEGSSTLLNLSIEYVTVVQSTK